MQNTSTSTELSEYKDTLLDLRKKLVDCQTQNNGDQTRHPSHDVVFLVAIDALLRTIGETNPDTLTLDGIVKIADEVREVRSSVNHFISRHQVVVRQQSPADGMRG